MTCWGTCVPAGPSRNAAGCPFTCNFSDGNCARTHVESSGLLPVSCKAGVLIFVSRCEAKLSGQLVSHSQAPPLKCRRHDKMTSVVPHSCRASAGYQLRATFLKRCIVPESFTPTERTR